MIGTTVAQYRITDQLGQGGMGIVYKATDTKLDRDVALKFLPPHLSADPDAKARFIQEAKAASGLDHPNICTIYDIGETDDGRLYIAMAYYDGQTLKYRMEAGAMPVDRALNVAAQIAQGLERAHEAGIVHRDIKPANIMVTDRGAVKLLDFGVAKLEQGADLTKMGSTVGTTSYMSPEQSQSGPVDLRSDLWSLGVVLYEMLAGQRPFDAGYDQAILYAILNQDPEPITTFQKDVPEDVVELLNRLLSKSPAARPTTAAEVVAALVPHAGILTHGSGTAHRTAVRATQEKPAGNRRVAMIGGAGALVVIILLAIFLLPKGQGDAGDVLPYNRVAIFPFAVNGDPSLDYLKEGFVNLLGTKLDGTGDLSTTDPNALIGLTEQRSGAAITPDDARVMAADLGAGSFILGSVTKLANNIQLDAAMYSDRDTVRVRVSVNGESEMPLGIDQLARELVAPRIEASTDPLRSVAAVTTTSFEALKAYLEGEQHLRNMERTEAHDSFKRAVEADSTFALGWYRFARAIRWGGGNYSTSGRINARRAALDRALEHRDDLPYRYRTLIQAADAFERGRLDEATELYARRIEQDKNDIEALLEYGDLMYSYNPLFGKSVQEARPVLERVLKLDANNPQAITILGELADLRGDRAQSDSLTALQLTLLDADAPEEQKVFISMHTKYEQEPDSLRALFESLPSAYIKTHLASDLVFVERKWDIGQELYERLDTDEFSEQTRQLARWNLYGILSARGQPEAADRVADDLGDFYAEVLVDNVMRDAVPAFAAPRERLESLRDMVVAWDTVANELNPSSVNEGHYGELKAFLLGVLAIRLQDQSLLGEQIAYLRGRSNAGIKGETPYAFTKSLEALSDWENDRPEEALANLDEGQLYVNDYCAVCSNIHSQTINRYARAEVLFSQGKYDEAVNWYASLFDGDLEWGLTYLGFTYLRTAAAAEAQGEPETAAENYTKFLELFKNPEPTFQSLVEDARQRLDALTRGDVGEPGQTITPVGS